MLPKVVIALLIIGALVVLSHNQHSLQFNQTTQIESQNKYQDSSLGFGLNYPKENYNLVEDTEEAYSKRNLGDPRKNFSGYVGYEPGKFVKAVTILSLKTIDYKKYDAAPFALWIFENPDNLSPEAWYRKYWYYPFLWGVFSEPNKSQVEPVSVSTVSGQLAKSATVSYQAGSPEYIYMNAKGKMFLIRIISEQQSVGSKILGSFRLTN